MKMIHFNRLRCGMPLFKEAIVPIRLGQISNNVPRKSPVGIFEEKGQTTFSRALSRADYE